MLLKDIIKTIQENEEFEWESEAHSIFYNVKYDVESKRVSVDFVEEYHYNGDNWGEIDSKATEHEIFFAEHISAEHYINMLISLINKSEDELEYTLGLDGFFTLKKIHFNRVQ